MPSQQTQKGAYRRGDEEMPLPSLLSLLLRIVSRYRLLSIFGLDSHGKSAQNDCQCLQALPAWLSSTHCACA